MNRRFIVAAVTAFGVLALACVGGCSDKEPRPIAADTSKVPPGAGTIKQTGQEQKLAGSKVPGT